MSTSTAKVGRAVQSDSTRVTSAQAGLDQAQAAVLEAEQAAAEAEAAEHRRAGEIADYERRIGAGHPDVEAARLTELQGLHRFEELHAEAARRRVIEAKQAHGLATAKLVVAEHREYEATDERDYRAAYRLAVDSLADLLQRENARAAKSPVFAAKRESARNAARAAGDSATVADIDALPAFNVHHVRGAVIALAIRHGLGADVSDFNWNFLQQLPLRVPLAEPPELTRERGLR